MQIKRLGYAPPRNWDAWGAFCLASLNIVILLSQQSSAFDGTCQVPPGFRGWSSPLVRQLSAPQSPESQRLLHVLLETLKQQSRASGEF